MAYLFTGKGHFFRWVNDIGGTNAVVGGTSLAVDGQDNLSVTGSFQHKIAFQGTTLTLSTAAGGSGTDGFVCGLSSNGTFLWADDFSGVRSTPRIAAVAVDAGGNVYVTGVFPGCHQLWSLRADGAGTGRCLREQTGQRRQLSVGTRHRRRHSLGRRLRHRGRHGWRPLHHRLLSHTVDFDPGSGVFRLTGPATLSPSAFFLDRLTQTQVQGTAVNAQAQPVAGVVVRLFGSFNSTIGDPDDALLVTTVTDSQGHYQLLGPADLPTTTWSSAPDRSGLRLPGFRFQHDSTGTTRLFSLTEGQTAVKNVNFTTAAPSFGWAVAGVSSIGSEGDSVITDAAGNGYVAGDFDGTLTLGSGLSRVTLNGGGGFVAKYSDRGCCSGLAESRTPTLRLSRGWRSRWTARAMPSSPGTLPAWPILAPPFS